MTGLPNDPRLYRQVANGLREQILDGMYKPGELVPSLATICRTYTVSRQTAGKAMLILSRESLVQFVPGRGYYVCELP